VSNLTWTFLGLFIFQKLSQLWLNARQINSIKKNQNDVALHLQDMMNLENHQKASFYNVARLKISQFAIFNSILLFVLFFPMRGVDFIQSWIINTEMSQLVQFLIFMLAVSAIEDLFHLPFELYQTFHLEKKFGLSNMTFKIYISDKIKSFFIGVILTAVLSWIFLKSIEWSEQWWLYFWIIFVIIQLTMLYLYPVLIAPLFNKFGPIENPELKEKLNQLARDVDFPLEDLQVMDASVRSNQSNAYFTGFGKKKKIVLFDTLIKQLSTDQLQAVLAHELGHFKLKHITKTIGAMFILSFFAFYLLGVLYNNPNFYSIHFVSTMTPFAAIFLFTKVLSVYLFPITPLASWISRSREFEADAFAKKYSKSDNLIEALKILSKENLAVTYPDSIYALFYYSHPPMAERIEKLKS
jgi:STE24 endopeptidase